MKSPSIAARAYVAGVLEGEGSFLIFRTKRRGKLDPRRSLTPRVTTSQKSPQILEFILRQYGGHLIYRERAGRSKTPIWVHIQSNSTLIVRMIKDIYPFLINDRTRLRAKYIYRLSKMKGSRGKRISEESWDKREKIYELWCSTRKGKRRQ